MTPGLLRLLALTALLLTAAIFGFFYAYAASVMWGLDAAPAASAIEAMQGINREVRNAAFAPSFFLTPVFLALMAVLARGIARLSFGAATLIYLLGGLVLTVVFNIPLNNELAVVLAPEEPAEADAIWSAFSGPWQLYNWVRTGFAGLAVLCTGVGLIALEAGNAARPEAET